MTAKETTSAQVTPQPVLAPNKRRRVLAYLGTLMMLATLSDPNSGLMDVPVSFLLKNSLQLDALQVSQFRFLISAPLFLSFLFGLLRDNYSPFGLGDRGHLLLFGALSTITFTSFAFLPASTPMLLLALLLVTAWSLSIAGAQNGLATTIGQQHGMTGQISAVWNIFTAVPAVIAFLIGGQLAELLYGMESQKAVRIVFLTGAFTSLLLVMFALFRAKAVYDNVTRTQKISHNFLSDLRRLVAHDGACRALLIWALWNFAPGSLTPMQFYLQDVLGGAPANWGQWNAIFTASYIPIFTLFGVLCDRVPLQKLLRWGTLIAIPQMIPLLFVSTTSGALISAVPIGLMGGLATASYVALIMRTAPIGLEGTMLMAASTVYFAASRFGDLLGSALYNGFGDFVMCVVLSTVIYWAILFILPKTTREGGFSN